MAPSVSISLLFLLVQIGGGMTRSSAAPAPNPMKHTADHATYIVHVNHLAKPAQFATHEHWYASMVTVAASSSSSSSILLYTYDAVMHGFAVQLTGGEEAPRRVLSAAGVINVYEDKLLHPLTTRSPGFLDLDPGWKDADMGDGVIIIGFVDTGIWPESPSFNDSGRAGGGADASTPRTSTPPCAATRSWAPRRSTAMMTRRRRRNSVVVPSPRDMDGRTWNTRLVDGCRL